MDLSNRWQCVRGRERPIAETTRLLRHAVCRCYGNDGWRRPRDLTLRHASRLMLLSDRSTSVEISRRANLKKVKVWFCVTQYAMRLTTPSTLHFTFWQTCSCRHQLNFSGKHSSHAAITREDYSITFPPPSIAYKIDTLFTAGVQNCVF